MATLIVAVIVVSAVWVYWDATSHKIGKVQGVGGTFNMGAGALFVGDGPRPDGAQET